MTTKNILSKSIDNPPIPGELIERRIYFIRGFKVMLDSDLAELYNVSTKVLNQAVKRNINRFPLDFMFQLTEIEYLNLRSQIVTSSLAYGGRRYLPLVFTEHGVGMLSSVLKSPRAVQMNILIIRTFIKMRDLIASHKDLAGKIEKLENSQKKHNSVIAIVINEIKKLKTTSYKTTKKRIGFKT
jgi:hypothetical protein